MYYVIYVYMYVLCDLCTALNNILVIELVINLHFIKYINICLISGVIAANNLGLVSNYLFLLFFNF